MRGMAAHTKVQGGAEVLAFVTRPTAPPAKETVSLLSGVIAGGALIRQTTPASSIQLKAGSVAANLGLGNFLMPAKMNVRVSVPPSPSPSDDIKNFDRS